MQTSVFMNQVWAEAGNTDTFPYVSLSQQRGLTISIPSIELQRTIAHVLGTLDDKIELNRRMNETLEAIARALFKSWFVDFDPVRTKAQSLDLGLSATFADLFPDSFQESELRGYSEGMAGPSFCGRSRDNRRWHAENFSSRLLERRHTLVLSRRCTRGLRHLGGEDREKDYARRHGEFIDTSASRRDDDHLCAGNGRQNRSGGRANGHESILLRPSWQDGTAGLVYILRYARTGRKASAARTWFRFRHDHT
jgi:hypothetical protein